MAIATDFVSGIYADTAAWIRAQWPEVKPGPLVSGSVAPHGIWQAERIDQVAYSELTPPYAVIHIYDLSSVDDEGITADAYMATVDVYIVKQIKGPLSGIQSNLQGLRQRINSCNPLPKSMQFRKVLGMSWGLDLDPNKFFASKKMQHRAGRLRFTALVRDTFFATNLE